MKIIIIENDPDIVDSVSLTIRIIWPESEIISTEEGNNGINLISSENPDIVILDLGLPDISGFEVLKQARLFSSVPVIVLTVRSEERDIVRALEMGADEYIIKPFKQLEFLSRLKLAVRKHDPKYIDYNFTIGKWKYDHFSNLLLSDGKEIHLSNTEGTILSHLFINRGKIVTFSSLANSLWSDDYPGCKDAIQVYIRRLRQKIELDPGHPKIILNKMGIGYYLSEGEIL